jgi:UDP-N-acetyl-D-galactosamine dehydrogenase
MIKHGMKIVGTRILVMGVTFKENCPDIRNSRVVDIVNELVEYGCRVLVYDPWADAEEVRLEYSLDIVSSLPQEKDSGEELYDACILAVAHQEFKTINPRDLIVPQGIVYDVKGFYARELVDKRL